MGLVRFLLAMSVVHMHYGAFTNFRLLYGTAVVQGFFIISGFYMALVLTEKYKDDTITFYIARALRIFPAYLIVLSLAALSLFILGRHTYLTSTQFIEELQNASTIQALSALVPNVALFGQDLQLNFCFSDHDLKLVADYKQNCRYPAHFNLVPQAWSIALELYFYAIAPLLARMSTIWLVVVTVLAAIARFAMDTLGADPQLWLYLSFPGNFVFFMLGMVSYRLYAHNREFWSRPFVSIGSFLALAGLPLGYGLWSTHVARLSPYLLDGHLFLYLAPILIPGTFSASKDWKLDRQIGELSYSIYIVHFLVYHWTFTIFEGPGKYGYFSSTLGLLTYNVVTVVAAVLIFVLIERPVERLRTSIRPPSVVTPPERHSVDLVKSPAG